MAPSTSAERGGKKYKGFRTFAWIMAQDKAIIWL